MLTSHAKQDDLKWKKDVLSFLETAIEKALEDPRYEEEVHLWNRQLDSVNLKLTNHNYERDEYMVTSPYDKYPQTKKCECEWCRSLT